VFDETPQSLAEKGYREPQPLTPGNFGYSVLRNSVHAELYEDLLGMARGHALPARGSAHGDRPGRARGRARCLGRARGGDRAALFKTFTKVLCQRRGLLATFMAKWSGDYPGQSGHAHVSLRGPDGTSVFHDARRARRT
jgi:glutamine synthetase